MKDTCPCKNCITVMICRHKSYAVMLKSCDLIYNYLYVVDSNGMTIRERFNYKKKIKHTFTHLHPTLWEIKDGKGKNTRDYEDMLVRTSREQLRKITGYNKVL